MRSLEVHDAFRELEVDLESELRAEPRQPQREQRALELPAGAPLTIFAIGRTIGWIAHAIEQYATGVMIRPRARYVGPR